MPTFPEIIAGLADAILTWGWVFLLFFALWIAWEIYLFLKRVDYVLGLTWTHLQITVPEESPFTPKAFENAVEVWGGIHKDPDLMELYFEGYMLPWYSLELQCTRGRARYIMVVPTPHAKFFEGVIYGQYPTAEIREVEDYAQEFSVQEIGKTFEMWGSEILLANDDIYPIRTYTEFEDTLAEDDRYIDPHAALVEAFTTINEGEHFWVQILVKPIAAKNIVKWAEEGLERISELSGEDMADSGGIFKQIASYLIAIPGELAKAAFQGPLEPGESMEDKPRFKIYNPAEDAEMKGILQKVQRNAYRVKIRVMHFAPVGKLQKPNYSKAIGVFKQFANFQLNNLKPDPKTKTNGPNFILKYSRRAYRMRSILANYQYRDFWGDTSGQHMTAEEIATLYHFPIKYVKAPAITRATSGLGSPPANLPYA